MNLIDSVLKRDASHLYAWLLIGLVMLTMGLIWVTTRFRYHIGEKHLEVRLFGICVRRVAFGNIERVSKRPPTISENWGNTFRPGMRQLVIHRRRGLLKELVITPRNRYLFKAQLEQAMRGGGMVTGLMAVGAEEEGVIGEGDELVKD